MFNRETYKLIGPVRSVTSVFSELEVIDDKIVEIRRQPADLLLFDWNGKLLEENSPEREILYDVRRDVYVYGVDGELSEREEYARDGLLIGKTRFEIDSEGNRVENQYYLLADGRMLLGSRVIRYPDGRIENIYFDADGRATDSSNAPPLRKTTIEFSETKNERGHVLEERRFNEENGLTLRIVTQYDERGNEIEYSTYDHELDGEMYIKQEFKYEFDSVGNWTTQTVFRWVVGWGPFRLIPYTRTRRTIEYF
jgi:hypothetical protein